MKRLVPVLVLCLLLTGCTVQMDREEAMTVYDETKPITGVYVDTSRLTAFQPPQEIYTRRSEERVEELTPGDYGLLRPFVGSRAAFDMTIYGGEAVYNGRMGLIDENGAIVVDPVYTDITYLYDWNRQDAPRFYRLSKQVQKDDYMDQIYGFCSLDGSVAQPCIYESVGAMGGYIVAVEQSKDGLFKIFDRSGQVLLDSASWETRPKLHADMMGGTPVEAAGNLLYLTVVAGPDNWDVERWLYDWQGNLLSADYDWMELGAELPYACGTWDDWDNGFSGYVDAEGNQVNLGNLKRTGAFHFGQAVVEKDGVQCVIDTEGTVLWTAPEGYLSQNVSDTTVYYNHEISTDREFVTYRWYNKDFQPMYPEAEYAHWLYDDWFVVWQDGACSVTDGERSAVLEGAIPDREYYDAFDTGAKDLLLITTWKDSVQKYWLFDKELKLLSHGIAEDSYVELLTDRTDGSAVAVTYERMTYPYHYTVLDYPGAPKLQNVNVLGIYGGWYMVEDEFSAGYMDADGNWLFRISLMADMTD